MGAEFATAALDAGHAVVATGRDTDDVAEAVGESEDLLVAELDVTKPADAESATQAAMDRFGRVDVLVNNAGISYKGFFEEMTIDEIKDQLEVNLFGQMYVTRAVLPVMRDQRSGHVISISSGAGLSGFAFSSAYATSKFGVEGWMDALHDEIEPFGIDTTVVNPGFFRTSLTAERSMPSPTRRSTTTTSAERSKLSGGRNKAVSNRTTRPGSPSRSSRSPARKRPHAGSSPVLTPSNSRRKRPLDCGNRPTRILISRRRWRMTMRRWDLNRGHSRNQTSKHGRTTERTTEESHSDDD